jgi:hypothetical protein
MSLKTEAGFYKPLISPNSMPAMVLAISLLKAFTVKGFAGRCVLEQVNSKN